MILFIFNFSRTKIVFFIFYILVFGKVFTQTKSLYSFDSIIIPEKAKGRNFYSVTTFSKNMYVACDGLILVSSDNGREFKILLENDDYVFYDVKFADINTGFAVSVQTSGDKLNKRAVLFKTVDGGKNWINLFTSTRKCSVTETNLRQGAIDILDESRLIWGVGTTQFYSATGGRANHCTVTPIPTYSACFPNVNKAFIGSQGILESSRGGVSYGISGYQSSEYYDLDLVTSEYLYAIEGDELLKIAVNDMNSSHSISIRGIDQKDRFIGVDFLDLKNGCVIGDHGRVAYTLNGGENWKFIQSPFFTQLNDIVFINSKEAVIVGNNNSILKLTINEFNTEFIQNVKTSYNESSTKWNSLKTQIDKDFYEISSINGYTYIAGDGVVIKSIDTCKTFSVVFENPNLLFHDIAFVDSLTGWVIGLNNKRKSAEVYKTFDGGKKWKKQTDLPANWGDYISGTIIEALDESYIFASYSFKGMCSKKISTNGGKTWKNVGGNFAAAEIADFIFFGNNISPKGHQGFGLKQDAGGSYFVRNLDIGEAGDNAGCNSLTYPTWKKEFGMNSVSSAQSHLAIARDMDFSPTSQCTFGYIERTKVGNPKVASDWGCYNTYNPVHFYGVKMISANEIWLVGENGTIIHTKNRHGGIISESSESEPQKEWLGHDSKTHEHLFDIELVAPNVLVAVGKNGTIIKSE